MIYVVKIGQVVAVKSIFKTWQYAYRYRGASGVVLEVQDHGGDLGNSAMRYDEISVKVLMANGEALHFKQSELHYREE